jgi:tetratricopeptide (TPR) repeat protein
MSRSLLVLAYILCVLSAGAQYNDDTLIRLKMQLPGLNSADRLASYTRIARIYLHSLPVRPDSATNYSQHAYVLAQNLGNKKEQGVAAILYAHSLLQKGMPDEGKHYYRIAMEIGRELNDENMEATGIRGIGQALWYQGNYEQAIDTIVLSISYFRRLGRMKAISDATVIISSVYGDQGNYKKAFEAAQEALLLSKQYNDSDNIVLSLVQIGKLYRSIGDYSTAMEYYKRGYNNNPPRGDWTYRHLAHSMGDMYLDRQLYDSALYYYRQSFSGNPGSRFSKLKMGQYYLLRANYDSAFAYFDDLYITINKGGEGHILYGAMLGLGHVYLERKEFTRALWFANRVLTMSRIKDARLTIQEACHLLSVIYTRVQQPGMALSYFREYVQLKDSIVSDQFKGRLFESRRIIEDEKKMAQIELLKKEKLLSEQQLRSNRFLRNILLGGILVLTLLSGVVVWIIMLKRKNEKLRNESSRIEWERLATDLEMQALRAQMNPHFIFNCLSSINKFILKNEPDRASDYLTRFSRLIRLVLINSQKELISLEDEIEMLRLYIEMEQLRFRHHFNYNITYTNDIKPGNIMIPPLLLQPFCENAIWHGLMHKKDPGQLSIAFAIARQALQCTITDDGIGRAKAAEIKKDSGEERKSLGLKLTAERLALFNEESGFSTSWTIEDIKDTNGNTGGTRVILKIRHREWIEENT